MYAEQSKFIVKAEDDFADSDPIVTSTQRSEAGVEIVPDIWPV